MLSRGLRAALATMLSRRLINEFGNLNRAERSFMLRVSTEDFFNYVKVEQGFIYDYSPDERASFYLEVLSEREPLKLAHLLDDWFSVWALKWRQRVRLAMGDREDESLVEKIRRRTAALQGLPIIGEAKRFALGSLIRSGEVCFTNLLSDSVVRGALYHMLNRASSPEEVKRALERNPALLLDEVIKRVRSLVKYKGPLVTLKLEIALFSDEGLMSLGFW
ncbi:MAG: hypothetical protein DRJ96_00630 [Thermoprotei archaeon]|nr:MAG: hypothetical protein DRJ67_07025 [Thermoprotei archaeon]RLE98613.1 MAG: hypothetical protein DRJ96_00630 [Thermoprotei archaeon]